ncbi:hypothetical protein EC957_008451 [Mortierella hygrophila]|uniref:Uncharacterized protein n=1 Tax=Mortierella hygrophila TaxID=979708 RepID=A0A9P6K5M7_9FUNG|nr:hypothetical protein EC957_008451 [Mortierella hygrophila]
MDTYVPKSVFKDRHVTADNQQSQQQQQVQTPAIVVSIAAATGPSTTAATIDDGSYQKATLPYPQSSASTKNKNSSSSKLLLGAKGNRHSNNNAEEDEEVERRNSEDEADEYEYQEYKRARKLKKQQKQEAKELKTAEKQREKQKKNDRKRALKKAKAGGRRVSVSVSDSRRGSQSSGSYSQGASGGRLGLGIVGRRGGEEQEAGEMVSQGVSTGRRESLGGSGGVVVMKKRSRVAKLFLRKKAETTQTPAYALITKATEAEEEEGIALQPLERGQGQDEDKSERERDRQFSYGGKSSSSPLPGSLSASTDDLPHQHSMQVDNPSSSTFSFSSASVTPSLSSKPHRLDLSFGENNGVGKKEGVKGKGGIAETMTALKSPASPHGGVAGGGNCGRCYLRRVWSKIKHPHRNSNKKQKPGVAAAVMVPAMLTKKSLAAQA